MPIPCSISRIRFTTAQPQIMSLEFSFSSSQFPALVIVLQSITDTCHRLADTQPRRVSALVNTFHFIYWRLAVVTAHYALMPASATSIAHGPRLSCSPHDERQYRYFDISHYYHITLMPRPSPSPFSAFHLMIFDAIIIFYHFHCACIQLRC